ncbi:recombinase-like helix-turn-helix domain-containing protein [Rhodococcus oxybenzonivorans]|uniref:recombinase-like helix-turn-helix domain-containing protein n=1 Tax=Rhodococcus oxybenzonivorans TaxID=1990687 RepID=UPI002953F78E|nr:recombinase-like helix-turn-helix domain-containing protein [Rhodococcus oxybenzonivorans]MDV7353868.1 recombinase-like helix-turn-helix domain-containing protein [Rhodococcus oxybenzonivorans]
MSLYLQPRQAGTASPTPYELKLAGAIEEVFGTGVHHLEGLVKGLNDLGICSPSGEPWTPDTFTDEMRRMAA